MAVQSSSTKPGLVKVAAVAAAVTAAVAVATVVVAAATVVAAAATAVATAIVVTVVVAADVVIEVTAAIVVTVAIATNSQQLSISLKSNISFSKDAVSVDTASFFRSRHSRQQQGQSPQYHRRYGRQK